MQITGSKNIEKIAVIDFGSQFNQTIARRLRELGYYAELISRRTSAEHLVENNVKGIILTSSPRRIHSDNAFKIDKELYDLDIPMLGIGYGMERMVVDHGGQTQEAASSADTLSAELDTKSLLFKDLDKIETVYHTMQDKVTTLPEGFKAIATTSIDSILGFELSESQLYGVHFHPEALQTESGSQILENFAANICDLDKHWSAEKFIDLEIEKIREQVGNGRVILGLSGGVDSSVASVLLHRAIEDQLTCIFVDHGLLRKGEADSVMKNLGDRFGLKIVHVNAADRFLGKLSGVSDPEKKRKIIGEEFIHVFAEEAEKIENVDFLAQGTIYTDIIESGTDTAETIKSHHNVGGLPEEMDFELVEPLSTLFKDEVREVGEELGIPSELVWRQPFPGPGLGVRVIGEITEEKLEIARETDDILREVIAEAGLQQEIWQYFTVVPGFKSVGVSNDKRTYGYTVAIRAVHSVDGVTSQWARIPYDVLAELTDRMTSEVNLVNRVVYDITGKPPATIEWE